MWCSSNPGRVRAWLLVLCAGCGQMYQAPEPPPASASASSSGAPRSDQRPTGAPVTEAPAPARPATAEREAFTHPEEREPSAAARPAPRGPARREASTEADAMLAAHNRVRAKHCAGPLTWSPKLAQVAQRWATSLRDKDCAFGHSNGAYGENLAAGTSGVLDPAGVVAMWYGEVEHYKFPDGGFSMKTGHFTQVVWRGTTQVGCGRAQCKGMDIWVCEYDPPGNWEGKYRENVLPTSCR